MGDINCLWPTIGWSSLKLSNLFQALQEYKDLSSPRKSSAKAERELASREEKLNDEHVDLLDPELDFIPAMLQSMHYSIGILMQIEDNLFEWIFFTTQSRKLKT